MYEFAKQCVAIKKLKMNARVSNYCRRIREVEAFFTIIIWHLIKNEVVRLAMMVMKRVRHEIAHFTSHTLIEFLLSFFC